MVDLTNKQHDLFLRTLSSLERVAREYNVMKARVNELENDMTMLVEKEVGRTLQEVEALRQKKAHRLEKKGKRRDGKRKR